MKTILPNLQGSNGQRMFIKKKSMLYALRGDVLCFSWTRLRWILYCHRCLHTNAENTNTCEHIREEGRYCMVVLLKQYGLVLVNISQFRSVTF